MRYLKNCWYQAGWSDARVVEYDHYFYCSTRPYRTADLEFTQFLRGALEQAFANEDKPMLERQQDRIGDQDFWSLSPVLLAVDAAAVRARRKLRQLIDLESTEK